MKTFILMSLWLTMTTWPFITLVLNKGKGAVKKITLYLQWKSLTNQQMTNMLISHCKPFFSGNGWQSDPTVRRHTSKVDRGWCH